MEAGTIKYKFTNESFEKMIDEIVMEPDSAKASLDCFVSHTKCGQTGSSSSKPSTEIFGCIGTDHKRLCLL